jgi:hypothetical protein
MCPAFSISNRKEDGLKFNYHNEFAPELMHELMHEEQHIQMQENLSDMGYQMMSMHGELEMMADQMAKGEISNYAQEDLLMAWESFYHEERY